MYEDNLYLSTLYEYLEQPPLEPRRHCVSGPDPDAGVQFEHVRFTYPGAETPAIDDLTLQDRAGPERRARRSKRLGQDDARQAARAALRAEERS